jgi:hypothetical protein
MRVLMAVVESRPCTEKMQYVIIGYFGKWWLKACAHVQQQQQQQNERS